MKALFFLILSPCLTHAGPYYEQVVSTTAGTSTMTISGYIGVAASSTTPTTYKIRIDGVGGYIQFPDSTKQTTAYSSSTAIGDVFKASTQTFTGANTFSSTVTFSTRNKITFGNELHNSSSTFTTTDAKQGTEWLCAIGSTITITTQGNTRAQITHSGSMQISPATYTGYLSVIVDGVALQGQKGFCAQYLASGVTAGLHGCSFSVLTDTLSAAAHTFCLAGRTNSSAATLTFGYADVDNATQFSVQELR